jgi:imidazolonepropionase-like amidohydrolase
MSVKLFRNGFLIDGNGQEPLEDMDLLVDGNEIVEIAHQINLNNYNYPLSDVDIIELNGKTMMPGMTEAHVHLAFDDTVYLQDVDMKSVEESQMDAVKNARILVESGFTSAVSAAVRGRIDIVIRDAVQKGIIVGPRLAANGPEVSSTGGFVHLMPAHIQMQVQGLAMIADGEDGIRRAVRSLLKEGADVVKLNVSGDSYTKHARSEMTLYTFNEVKAAVDEAHARKKRVYTHARSCESVKICVEAGVDIIGHADFIDDEVFEMIVANKDRLFIVPAMGNLVSILERGPKYFGQAAIDATEYKEGLEIAIPNLSRLYRAGVRVLPGGDYGFAWNPHGEYARDLEHFVNLLGMTPMDAIISATKYGGQIILMEDQIGTLQVGKLADILVVDGNPLEDIRILQDHSKLQVILQDGKYIKNSLPITKGSEIQVIA